MSIITIASSKGGPGKTLVTSVVAGRLAADCRVVAIDADPTCQMSRWAREVYEGPRFEVHAETDETRLAHLIDAQAQEADVVLVDTAGFGNRAAAVAMTCADVVLIPVLPGAADVIEAEKTVRLVEGLARAARRPIPARVVLNRMRNTNLAKYAASQVEGLALPTLAAALSDLVAYGEMSFSGAVPQSGQAGGEVDALIAELRELGWVPALRVDA